MNITALKKAFFEYYTAVRAHEIDPIKGETIDAYVSDNTLNAALRRMSYSKEQMTAQILVSVKQIAMNQR